MMPQPITVACASMQIVTKPSPLLQRLKYRAQQRDKQQHLAFSYGLVLLGSLAGASLPIAVTGTMALGLCKEVWDKYRGSGFCWYDMLANTLGTGAAILTIYLFNG